MEIKLDELHTYLHCPIKYKFKFVDGIKGENNHNIIYKKTIHKTVSYFFYSAMGGWLPSLNQMKDKWANSWKEATDEKTTMEDILLSTSKGRGPNGKELNRKDPTTDRILIRGVEMIHNFYHFNKDNPGNIIGVDLDYRAPVGDITISGKFELVREIEDPQSKKRYVEIVDFKTGTDTIDPFLIKNDLNLSIASFAFRNLFQAKEDRLKYHYLKTGRDIITQRKENDFKRMEKTVEGVANGIEKKDFYPRQSYMCRACEFKDICDRVKF